MSTEELKPYVSQFVPFIIGGQQMPPPRDKKITVYFDGTKPGIAEAFVVDTYWSQIGILNIFITSWIEHSELIKLME